MAQPIAVEPVAWCGDDLDGLWIVVREGRVVEYLWPDLIWRSFAWEEALRRGAYYDSPWLAEYTLARWRKRGKRKGNVDDSGKTGGDAPRGV